KRIQQVASGRSAPAGAQVEARNGEEPGLVGGKSVIAGGNVVEGGVIASSLAERINRGVDKADGRLAVSLSQFIGQGGEARPQRRRSAGARSFGRIAVVVENPNVIRDHGDIRTVPPSRGAMVCRHAEAL